MALDEWRVISPARNDGPVEIVAMDRSIRVSGFITCPTMQDFRNDEITREERTQHAAGRLAYLSMLIAKRYLATGITRLEITLSDLMLDDAAQQSINGGAGFGGGNSGI